MAYDELDNLAKQRTFAKRAITDLLQCNAKSVRDSFKSRIDTARSQNEISRIMVDVRRAI